MRVRPREYVPAAGCSTRPRADAFAGPTPRGPAPRSLETADGEREERSEAESRSRERKASTYRQLMEETMSSDHGTHSGSHRLRASDAEREQIATILRAAMTEGRLNLQEGEERLAAAYAATYRDELGPLT
ncbi:MAG TPA: DUF1707 domain-containing protein, partial [Pilimelia sp.]|nr:DUF1707 domain-containing protein [Pilimelia sp.]